MRQRPEEYTGGVGYLIITLILSFGSALVGIGVKLIRGQQRMEQRQAVALAALRAQVGAPDPEHDPDRRHGMFLVPPVAALAGIALLLRRHWVRTVSAAGGALAATAVVLGLLLGHQPPPAVAGPPQAGQPTTVTSLTGATVPTTAGSAASSRPAPVSTAPGTPVAAPTTAAATVVLAAEAPALPPPTVAPSTLPVPSRSPSAPGTTPAPTGQPTPVPSGSTSCLLAVNAQPILGVCLL